MNPFFSPLWLHVPYPRGMIDAAGRWWGWGGEIAHFSQFVENSVDTAQLHLMKVLRSSSLWYSLNDVTVTQELADVDWRANTRLPRSQTLLRYSGLLGN